MGIKDIFQVNPIPPEQVKEWVKKKHYAHRKPMAAEYCYGLYRSNILEGVSVFGPTSPTVPVTVFGEVGKHKIRELTRLIVNDGLERGVLSFFLSQCFKLLPRPMCLVSFADEGAGHHGYIYQATNWLYTGKGGEYYDYLDRDGKSLHRITLVERGQALGLSPEEYINSNGITKTEAKPKHRYIYFIGSKKEIKDMKKDFKCQSLPYPKGDNERYDSSYKPASQMTLF